MYLPTCCAVLCSVTQSCPTLCDTMNCSLLGFSVHGDSPGKNTGVGCHALPQGNLPHPGIEPRSPALPEDSLPSESPGKPKNTGMGSLSLLPGIFPTQELNQDLLHCREVLYQLSYRGPPLTNICADISWNAYVSAFELLTFSVVTYISFTVITFI